ncbi:MAG: toll/interleukin-1 receptor domain-containing protein [Bryobacteraceae bacterium]
MKRGNPFRVSASKLSRHILECLRDGTPVEIDGLGSFQPDGEGHFTFVPRNRPQIFIAYVVEDAPEADRISHALEAAGFDVWLDRQKLLPGQFWPRAIERAIESSKFFIACLSRRSVGKRGQFQAEMRYAMHCASLVPQDEIFFIPVRLDECTPPLEISRTIQYIDLFPDWERGITRVVASARRKKHAA